MIKSKKARLEQVLKEKLSPCNTNVVVLQIAANHVFGKKKRCRKTV